MIRAAALTVITTLTVAACALTTTRPPDNNGGTPDTTTTTVTVPLAPLPDQTLSAATVAAPAARHQAIQIVTPPPAPTTTVALTGCDEMRAYRIAVGLPDRFDGIGWRESNCRNEDGVRTFCCHGWWQLYVSLHLRDHRLVDAYHACGVYHHTDLNSNTAVDKQRAACATKALYDEMGYQPWAATA